MSGLSQPIVAARLLKTQLSAILGLILILSQAPNTTYKIAQSIDQQ